MGIERAGKMRQYVLSESKTMEDANKLIEEKYIPLEKIFALADVKQCEQKCKMPGETLRAAYQANSQVLQSTFQSCLERCGQKR